jgi:hypothetical protein
VQFVDSAGVMIVFQVVLLSRFLLIVRCCHIGESAGIEVLLTVCRIPNISDGDIVVVSGNSESISSGGSSCSCGSSGSSDDSSSRGSSSGDSCSSNSSRGSSCVSDSSSCGSSGGRRGSSSGGSSG